MATGLLLAGLAAATGASITAPIIAREIAAAAQRVTPVDITVAGKRILSQAPPEIEKELASTKVKTADIGTRALIEKSIRAERDVKVPLGIVGTPLSTTLSFQNVKTPFGSAAELQAAIPGAMSFRAAQYEATLVSELIDRGYSRDKALRIARVMAERFRAEPAGEASAAIATSVLSEAAGAKLAATGLRKAAPIASKKAVRTGASIVGKSAGIAGLYEGFTMEATKQAPGIYYRGKQPDVPSLALATGAGGLSAATLGGAIGGLSLARGRVGRGAGKGLLGAAYLADPFEAPGDILAGKFIEGKAPGFPVPVATITPSLTATPVQEAGAARARGRPKKAKGYKPQALSLPAEFFGAAPTPVSTVTAAPTAVPSAAPTPASVFVPAQTTVQVPAQATTTVPAFVPGTVFTPTETLTEAPATTQTEVPSTVSTPAAVPSVVSSPVPVAVARAPLPILPAFGMPPGGGGWGYMRKGRFVYFDEAAAAKRLFRQLL